MQLHPSNLTDAEPPFFGFQRALDRLARAWRERATARVPAGLTLALPSDTTIILEGGEIELLDDSGTLWVTRECESDVLLSAGGRVRVAACGRTVVQALSRARVRIAQAA